MGNTIKKQKYYYKVVTMHKGSLCNILCSAAVCSHAHVMYHVGQWVTPPVWLANRGYGLCCFDTLANAKKWLQQVSENECTYELYKVEVKRICKLQPRREIWQIQNKRLGPEVEGSEARKWPKGTIMATAVKLVKELPNKYRNIVDDRIERLQIALKK